MRPGAHVREEQKERGRNRQQVCTQPGGSEREQRTAHKTKMQALGLGCARLGAGALGAAGGLATWIACDRPVPTPDEPGDPRLDLHEREERTEVLHSDAQRKRTERSSTWRLVPTHRPTGGRRDAPSACHRTDRVCTEPLPTPPVLSYLGPEHPTEEQTRAPSAPTQKRASTKSNQTRPNQNELLPNFAQMKFAMVRIYPKEIIAGD